MFQSGEICFIRDCRFVGASELSAFCNWSCKADSVRVSSPTIYGPLATTRRKEFMISSLENLVGKNPARIGALLATFSLPAHFILPDVISHQLAAVVLTLVAGIYVGFAVQDGRMKVIATEGSVALFFAAAALVGMAFWHWTIVLAYVLHGFWDLAHHRSVDTAMPKWYVPFCALFDWVFAAGLIAAWAI